MRAWTWPEWFQAPKAGRWGEDGPSQEGAMPEGLPLQVLLPLATEKPEQG